MPTRFIRFLCCAVLGLACVSATAGDDLEAWLESDDDGDAQAVNEGELEFLTDPQGRRVLQTSNWLTVTHNSLQTGWVGLQQCQANLDPVPAVEVVYRYHGLRDLQLVSSKNVARAWVAGNSVQLEDVSEGGEICIRAEVQVLKPDDEGGYALQSGPFHRRFLDGYYPVQLDYRVHWPADRLQLLSVLPDTLMAADSRSLPGSLAINALFEGRLTISCKWRALH